MTRRLLRCLAASCLGLGVASPARAVITDPSFVETRIATGLKQLTGLAWAPDGTNRLFTLRKGGVIQLIENGQLLDELFATVAPLITNSECGAIGLAFDPDFASNGYLYVFVTVSASEQQIVRYTATGNVGSERTVVVAGLPTQGINHDGGAIGFGPDGKLYWAIGDNGSPRRGADADLATLAAKVGRANRDGSAPQDNPFFDGDGPNNDYIWARGFRNPFTMTFQPATGRLWLNVVGTYYEQVFTPLAGDHGGWDNYESNQPAGYLAPVVSYDTNSPGPRPIAAAGATRSAGVGTITTTIAHKLRPGGRVTIADVTDPSFNGTFVISSVDPLSFTFLQAGPDATSGGGTATPPTIGGAITGGAFWDSTAVPADYRGNFFFGDYNTGAMMRAQLGKANQVLAVDPWGSGLTRIVDMAVGPDGDLYYGAHTGGVFQARHTATAQAIVVSQLNVRLAEGGKAGLGVRLALAPTTDRVVTTTWLSGDSDVSVVEGASLTFTAANWSTPQRVLLGAGQDVDSLEDAATVRVASGGLGKPIVNVRVTDDETFSLVVSPSSITVEEGASAELAVSLTQPPLGSLQVSLSLAAAETGASLTSGPTLSFDASNWSTPQTVTLTAAEDPDPLGGVAILTLFGTGLTSRDVEIAVHDNEERAPHFSSTPVLTAVVGAPYAYDVDAEGLPEPVYSLDVGPLGMTIDPSTGVIAWTPDAELVESAVVRATNGVSPDALQTFDIEVVPDQAPNCSLTSPQDGAEVSGDDAEFFGDVFDDVGASRAEFLIDGELAFEDDSADGHYHLGGAHNLFDTTKLADGEHVLAMRGYDTSGQTCVAHVAVTVANAQVGAAGGGAGGDSAGGAPGQTAGAAGLESAGGFGNEMGEGGVNQASGGEAQLDGAAEGASDGAGCDCRAIAARPGVSSESWSLLFGLVALACGSLRRGSRPAARRPCNTNRRIGAHRRRR